MPGCHWAVAPVGSKVSRAGANSTEVLSFQAVLARFVSVNSFKTPNEPSFPARIAIWLGFRNLLDSPEMHICNSCMSSVRALIASLSFGCIVT